MWVAVDRLRRVPNGALIGSVLCLGSAALYFFFASLWGVAAMVDDPVAEPASISFHGWLGVILSAFAAAGCCAALLAAREGVRLWNKDRMLAVGVLSAGALIGILPAWQLLTVPMYA